MTTFDGNGVGHSESEALSQTLLLAQYDERTNIIKKRQIDAWQQHTSCVYLPFFVHRCRIFLSLDSWSNRRKTSMK